MTTKLEGGGGVVKALVVEPIKKYIFAAPISARLNSYSPRVKIPV